MENYELDVNYLLDGKNLSRKIPVDLDAYRQATARVQNDTDSGELVKKDFVVDLFCNELEKDAFVVNDLGEIVGMLDVESGTN